jgi:hypothetical protein
MLPYVVSFLGLALFPLALAGYGGHLATLALTEQKPRRRAIFAVWTMAILGVVFAGLQQIEAYHSDKDHDEKQEALRSKLDASLQAQQYTRGQLDSIGLMIGKVGERSTDPVLGQLAGAIVKMTESTRSVNQVSVSLKPEAWSKDNSYTWKHGLDTTTPGISCFDAKGEGVLLGITVIDKNTVVLRSNQPNVDCTLRK